MAVTTSSRCPRSPTNLPRQEIPEMKTTSRASWASSACEHVGCGTPTTRKASRASFCSASSAVSAANESKSEKTAIQEREIVL